MKFLHSMIRVKDIDASLKFYTELLNMKLDHKKRLEDCELYFLNDESGCCPTMTKPRKTATKSAKTSDTLVLR